MRYQLPLLDKRGLGGVDAPRGSVLSTGNLFWLRRAKGSSNSVDYVDLCHDVVNLAASRDHQKESQSLRNQSVAFLFCVVGGFLAGEVICVLILGRSFCSLVSFFVA